MRVVLTSDYNAARLRAAAQRSQDEDQARRLLALAAMYDGATTSKAASIGGMSPKTLRLWVHRLNEFGPDSLVRGKSTGRKSVLNDEHRTALSKFVQEGPNPAVHGVERWRILDLCRILYKEFGVMVSSATVSCELRALGYRKLSMRPSPDAKADAASDRKTFPRGWMHLNKQVDRPPRRDDAIDSTGSFVEVLALLPPSVDLDAIALRTKAIKSKREVTSGAALLQIALARGPGGLSLVKTATWASLHGIAQLTDAAILYRLARAEDFLIEVSGRILAATMPGANLLWPGRTMRIIEKTCLRKADRPEVEWHIHGVFDLERGGFSLLEITDAEALERGVTGAGEIYVGDNIASPALRRFPTNGRGAGDFILGLKEHQLAGRGGAAFDLTNYLQRLPPGPDPHEVWVQAPLAPKEPDVPVRLIARREASDMLNPAPLALPGPASRRVQEPVSVSPSSPKFTILATSLPESDYSIQSILDAYELRGHIACVLKGMRSILDIDRTPSGSGSRRAWLYTHLILALLSNSQRGVRPTIE